MRQKEDWSPKRLQRQTATWPPPPKSSASAAERSIAKSTKWICRKGKPKRRTQR